LERSYQEIARNLGETELKSYELCNEIRQLMDSLYARSFESIIEDKIRKACPSLKREKDRLTLDDNNINYNGYVDHLVFDLIFRGVEPQDFNLVKAEEIHIRPIIDRAKKNDQTYYELEHQGVCLAIGNDEQVLSTLKQVISELLTDNRILEIVKKYYKAYNSQEWKMYEIRKLSDRWYAGHLELPEENYPVCDGCPRKPDVER
jgi:hypothetical protein